MRLADLRGTSVAVWGTGREGRAAVTAIAAHGPSRLLAVDDSANFLVRALGGRAGRGWRRWPAATTRSARWSPPTWWCARRACRRPTRGWPSCASAGSPVTGGTALWMADHADRTVGVTGSKGKSTTSSLISHLLAAVGRPNVFGGNIGVPLLDLPAGRAVRPGAVQLPVQRPDRLAPGGGGHLAVPGAPGRARRRAGVLPRQAQPARPRTGTDRGQRRRRPARRPRLADRARTPSGFAPVAGRRRRRPVPGRRRRAGVLQRRRRCSRAPRCRCAGRHNGRNLCVALAVLDGMGVDVVAPSRRSRRRSRDFAGLPHRLTEIADPSGLTFVDDTLSTSPYSAMHAIDAYEGRPLTVLVGGTDRGLDYAAAARAPGGPRSITVIGIPDSGPRIVAELAGLPGVRTEVAEDLPAAVRLARKLTPGRRRGAAVAGRAELRPVPQLRAPLRGLRRRPIRDSARLTDSRLPARFRGDESVPSRSIRTDGAAGPNGRCQIPDIIRTHGARSHRKGYFRIDGRQPTRVPAASSMRVR